MTESTIEIQLTNASKAKEGFGDDYSAHLPEPTKTRFAKYGIDISKGYPERPSKIPIFLDEAYKIRDTKDPNFVLRGIDADPDKKALFAKAQEVNNLTKHIGTEIVGLQLCDLNEQELDELALLVSERIVVFFRNQDLSPQIQLEIGEFFGTVEKNPVAAQVPGYPGITTIWGKFLRQKRVPNFKKVFGIWHTDLDFEFRATSFSHLHLDTIPLQNGAGGDTAWVSGYAAFDKLSTPFQKFLEGKYAIHRSNQRYYDRDDILSGPKHVEREHPIVITHPITGWKALFVNRSNTTKIVGLEPAESQMILNYLFDVLEKNLDIQVRFNWTVPQQDRMLGASAIWDNRICNHYAIADYDDQQDQRHGTRVVSLSDPLVYIEGSKSQREALGLDKER